MRYHPYRRAAAPTFGVSLAGDRLRSLGYDQHSLERRAGRHAVSPLYAARSAADDHDLGSFSNPRPDRSRHTGIFVGWLHLHYDHGDEFSQWGPGASLGKTVCRIRLRPERYRAAAVDRGGALCLLDVAPGSVSLGCSV